MYLLGFSVSNFLVWTIIFQCLSLKSRALSYFQYNDNPITFPFSVLLDKGLLPSVSGIVSK